jgi:hypothetical protein
VSRLLPADERFERRREVELEGEGERLLPDVSRPDPVSSALPLDVPRPELPEPDVLPLEPPVTLLDPVPVPVPRLPVPEIPTSAPLLGSRPRPVPVVVLLPV